MTISCDILEKLIGQANTKTKQEVFGEELLIKKMTQQITKRILESEFIHKLGYNKHYKDSTNNPRNGETQKTVKIGNAEIEIEVPRDRHGGFEPQLSKKGESIIVRLNEQILTLYANRMTVRDIEVFLQNI